MGTRGPKPKRKEVIWTADIAYATGLIATDGSLSKDGRHIDLTSKDTEQLENFLRCIGRKIRISPKYGSYGKEKSGRVQLSDVVLYNFLASIGFTPRKTSTLGALAIPDEYFYDFLRGHHDGDGCLYSYFDRRWKNSFMLYLVFLSASSEHVLWLQESLERMLGMKGHIVFSKSGSVWQLRYAKKEALAILPKMYPSKATPCLSRKRLKIEEALRIVGLPLPGSA